MRDFDTVINFTVNTTVIWTGAWLCVLFVQTIILLYISVFLYTTRRGTFEVTDLQTFLDVVVLVSQNAVFQIRLYPSELASQVKKKSLFLLERDQ